MGNRDWYDITLLLVQAFTLLALILYTGITGYQATISKDTAQRQLRAYIGIMEPKFGEKNPQRIQIPIQNGGQTPAYKVKLHLNTQWYPAGKGLPEDFTYPDYDAKTDLSSVAFLNPGQEKRFEVPIDNNKLEQMRNGEIDLFYYGQVEYFDIYGASRKSSFSYQYKGRNMPVNQDNGEIECESGVLHALVQQNKHNDAD